MRSAHWRTWTRKEYDRLRDLRGQGLTVGQIAAAMNRTHASISCCLERIDAPKHNPRRLEWLHALTSGLTERQCAERMGVSKNAVKRFK